MPFILGAKPTRDSLYVETIQDKKQLAQTFYWVGKRDAAAEILMAVRAGDGDTASVMIEIADQLLGIDPNHPHAQWAKQFFTTKERHDDQTPTPDGDQPSAPGK